MIVNPEKFQAIIIEKKKDNHQNIFLNNCLTKKREMFKLCTSQYQSILHLV